MGYPLQEYQPHMLITVRDREIDTRLFNTFERAHREMMEQLRATIRMKDEDVWFNVYRDDWAETDRFGFDETYAWSDTHPSYKYTWKIVEI